MAFIPANDFAIDRNENGIFDLVIEGGQFKTVYSFDTALKLIIFCDARADESEVPLPQNRRGWLGNAILRDDDFQMGSKLWLLEQERTTQNTLNKALDYVQKACDWLVDDIHVKSVEVTGTILNQDGFRIGILFTTLDNKVESRYYDLWFNTGR